MTGRLPSTQPVTPAASTRSGVLLLAGILGVACTQEPLKPAPEPEPEPEEEVLPDPPDLPVLTVREPERAAFTGTDPVRLVGSVQAGSAPLTTATVNDQSVSLGADGSISASLDTIRGLHILSTRVEDAGGERAVDGRAFIAGPVNEPDAVIVDGVRLVVGADMLDDDRPDVDDVATIAELVLSDPSILDYLLDVPLDTGFAVVTPTAASYGAVDVDLVPADGVLQAVVSIRNLELAYDVTDVAGFSWISTSGTASAGELVLAVDLAADRDLNIAAVETEAAIDELELSVGLIPDFLEPTLADWIQGTLESEIATIAEETLGDLLGGVVDLLAVETSFEGVDLALSVSGIDAVRDGLRVTMDVQISADPQIAIPEGAGSVSTREGIDGWPDGRDAAFSVAADDDVVNQLLYAFWASGALGGFTFSETELYLLTGSEVPAPLGPLNQVTLDGALPPVLSAPPDDEVDASLGLGELGLTFEREDGERFVFSVSARTGATLDVNEAGELTFGLDDRPARVELAVGTVEAPAALDPGDLAALIRLIVPPLLGGASSFLPGFPAPTLDLYELSELPALEGVELALQDPSISVQEDGGALMLTGRLADD